MKSIIHSKNTFLFLFVTVFTGLSFVCNAQSKSKVESQKSKDYQTQIQTGADQSEIYLPLLKDKKVGVLTNQTGITNYIVKEGNREIYDSRGRFVKMTDIPPRIYTESIIDFLIR